MGRHAAGPQRPRRLGRSAARTILLIDFVTLYAEGVDRVDSMHVKGLATDAAARAKAGVALVVPFGVVLGATGATLQGRQEAKANGAEATILLIAHGANIGHESR